MPLCLVAAAAVRAKLQQCANAAEPLADAAQCARALSRAGTQDAMQAVLEIALGSDTRSAPTPLSRGILGLVVVGFEPCAMIRVCGWLLGFQP